MRISRSILMGVVALPAFIGFSGMALAQSGLAPGSDDPSQNAVFTGFCPTLNDVSYKVDDSTGKTTSGTAYVNLPNGNVSFTQSVTGCVVINFSAFTFGAAGRLLFVRALVSGVVCPPFEVQFSGNDDDDGDGQWARSHAFNFVCPSVAAGAKTAQIQFRSLVAGQAVFIHRHSVIVNHE